MVQQQHDFPLPLVNLDKTAMPPVVMVTSTSDPVLQLDNHHHHHDDTSWIVQCFLLFPCCRRRRRRGSVGGSSSSMMDPRTTDRNLLLDECQWYEWDALQSSEWIIARQQRLQHQKQQQQHQHDIDNDDIDDEMASVLLIADCMIQENLTLIQFLMQTSAVELKQVLMPNIPFGTILSLRQAIHDKLQQHYPCPHDYCLPQQQQQQHDDHGWLAKYDQEYNNISNLQQQQQQQQINGHDRDTVPRTLRQPTPPPQPPGSFDSLRQSMKDRYGLELPEMHNHRDGNLATFKQQHALQPQQYHGVPDSTTCSHQYKSFGIHPATHP